MSFQAQNQEISLPVAVSTSDLRQDSSVQRRIIPKMSAQISGCQTTTSAATQPEFCAASKSKYSKWHLSTHSRQGCQYVGQLLRNISLLWNIFSLFKDSSQPLQGQQSTRYCSVCHAFCGIHQVSKTQTRIENTNLDPSGITSTVSCTPTSSNVAASNLGSQPLTPV